MYMYMYMYVHVFVPQVITLVCIAVWLINIGHFSDPAHGGSWIKVCYVCKEYIIYVYVHVLKSVHIHDVLKIRMR